jgi:hypothetical protein
MPSYSIFMCENTHMYAIHILINILTELQMQNVKMALIILKYFLNVASSNNVPAHFFTKEIIKYLITISEDRNFQQLFLHLIVYFPPS